MSSSEEKRYFLSKLNGPKGRGALNFAMELSDCPTLFWQLHYRQDKIAHKNIWLWGALSVTDINQRKQMNLRLQPAASVISQIYGRIAPQPRFRTLDKKRGTRRHLLISNYKP